MKAADFKLDGMLKFEPEKGQLWFQSQRMVMMSAESFGDLLKEIIDIGGVNMARVFMRRFGETAGKNDAKTIKAELKPDSDAEWVALGPAIHAWEGIVKSVPEKVDFNPEGKALYMKVKWENSFFAEQYLRHYGKAKDPVCWLLTGYATGYATELVGRKMICKESACKGKGDAACVMEITPDE
jgi:purine catabolism regulator